MTIKQLASDLYELSDIRYNSDTNDVYIKNSNWFRYSHPNILKGRNNSYSLSRGSFKDETKFQIFYQFLQELGITEILSTMQNAYYGKYQEISFDDEISASMFEFYFGEYISNDL